MTNAIINTRVIAVLIRTGIWIDMVVTFLRGDIDFRAIGVA